MSNMLMDDRPIMFLPLLAKALGSCEKAIVLQQIHWLSRQPNSGVDVDGYHWVWGTYEEWSRDYFVMWSPHTLRKHIQKLEGDDLLISAQLMAHQHNLTKYYRVNYAHDLFNTRMRPDVVASNRPDVDPSNEPDAVDSIYRTKTSTKRATDKEDRPSTGRKQNKSYRPENYDL